MEARDLDAEFRLLRKLTETKEHQSNLETIEKRKSSLLNRYAELKPCKYRRLMIFFLEKQQSLTRFLSLCQSSIRASG